MPSEPTYFKAKYKKCCQDVEQMEDSSSTSQRRRAPSEEVVQIMSKKEVTRKPLLHVLYVTDVYALLILAK